jgi:cation:H+ antiporter
VFGELSLPANTGLFLAAGALVWIAAWHVARYADAIESRTRLGEALIGMLLLGFISGLPEVATTLTAASNGHPSLAVNNLTGSAALNLAILAVADAAVKGGTLSFAIATPTPLLQAALMILMFALVGAAAIAPLDLAWLGIGAWSWAIFAVYLLCLLWIRNSRAGAAWKPTSGAPRRKRPARVQVWAARGSLAALGAKTAGAAAVIVVSGYVLAQSGEQIARRTDFGESFFGAVFMAFATSLTEIGIVISATRLGRYEMAIGDLFGSGLFCLALVFAVDFAYRDGPVLAAAGSFAAANALMGIAMTALFIAGVVERRNVKMWRIGVDSLAVLGTYLAGVVVLFELR